jgi:hypothetical protein
VRSRGLPFTCALGRRRREQAHGGVPCMKSVPRSWDAAAAATRHRGVGCCWCGPAVLAAGQQCSPRAKTWWDVSGCPLACQQHLPSTCPAPEQHLLGGLSSVSAPAGCCCSSWHCCYCRSFSHSFGTAATACNTAASDTRLPLLLLPEEACNCEAAEPPHQRRHHRTLRRRGLHHHRQAGQGHDDRPHCSGCLLRRLGAYRSLPLLLMLLMPHLLR